MNKKYMDFVPSKAPKATETPRRVVRTEVEEVSIEAIFAERPRPAGVSETRKVRFGVVEDLSEKFVKTEVAKRPLSSRFKRSSSKKATKDEAASAAKAKKVKPSAKAAAGLDDIFEKALKQAEKLPEEKTVAKIPQRPTVKPASPFVNVEKIDKRPLSKNVYQKKVVVPTEEPKGPVTIIAKPEKDSRVGTVVAIIITIILGATAGTVAFLLLPK